jgi:Ser/Thr protein kinase RdoA (MazF antagonist)
VACSPPPTLSPEYLRQIAQRFDFAGPVTRIVPFGNGHINDTFLCECQLGPQQVHQYALQNINTRVFRDPDQVMDNIARVTAHLRRKLEECGHDDLDRGTLCIVPTRDGAILYRDGELAWRSYDFIPGAVTHDVVTTDRQAYEAARMFARFQRLLDDLPPPRLHETIPHFHHTPTRFARLRDAIARDPVHRAASCQPEIAAALGRAGQVGRIVAAMAAGTVPERITHNDTKINNILFDGNAGHACCVIDLDTVMPGSSLYDFGDMVRTFTGEFAEHETDLSKVVFRRDRFAALVEGYLSEARSFLTPTELDLLAISGRLITFEIGIRFLTDYLEGDTYFKVHHPRENLDRARTQLQFVAAMEHQAAEMAAIIAQHR